MSYSLINEIKKSELLSYDYLLYPLFDDTLKVFNDNNKIIYVSNEECAPNYIIGVINDIYNYEGDDENYELESLESVIDLLKTKYDINY